MALTPPLGDRSTAPTGARTPAWRRPLEALGAPFVRGGTLLVELLSLGRLTLFYSARLRGKGPAIWEQLHEIGNRSLLFVAATLGFLGMVSIFQIALQLQKVIPDYSMVGAAFLKGMVRELGPTITGLMVATRTGSGIAAEIGSMVVTEQVDALRMTDADPVDYLVAPRFVACSVMVLVLSVFGVLVAAFSGMFMGKVGFGIPYETFFNLRLLEWRDLWSGAIKALAYGACIPIIAAHAGLRASGGSEGVGTATTTAVVRCSFAVILLDLLISSAVHVITEG